MNSSLARIDTYDNGCEFDFIRMDYPLETKLKVEVECGDDGIVQVKDVEFDNLHDYMMCKLHDYTGSTGAQLMECLLAKFSSSNPIILEKLLETHGRRIVTRGDNRFRYGKCSVDVGDFIMYIRDLKLGKIGIVDY